jgi:dTDP-4-amino-4,6-dideoxygalactose transaminase
LPDLPYGRQRIDESDIDAVVETLRGDWLTQGPTVPRFEEAVAEYVGAEHAVAFSSGTSALHGATFAAGLGPGDRVVTSPLTFMASANCARYVGAKPELVDIERSTWNLDPAGIVARPAAAVAVHYAGLPADLEAIRGRTDCVIEDAAHALGASTPDGMVGNGAQSDLCCFSFHPVKPITTAEGGMVTTNNPVLAERLRAFRSHGIRRIPGADGWAYEIDDVGFNYRLTDLQAALGLSQMRRIEEFIERRNTLADRYRTLLDDLPLTLPPAAGPGVRHGYHLFPVLVPERARVYRALHDDGIRVQVHYVPVHHHPVSRDIELPSGGLPVCDEVYAGLLSLPLHPGMSEADQDRVVDSLRRHL